jgi:hypothetical protein
MSETVIQLAGIAKPGDTVVIALSSRISDEEYEVLAEQWRTHVGDTIHLALVDGASAMLIARPGEDSKPISRRM